MHRQHAERQAALHDKLHEVHQQIATPATDKANGGNGASSSSSDGRDPGAHRVVAAGASGSAGR
jgi:hypothetical protein